jgi:hypothetical protein
LTRDPEQQKYSEIAALVSITVGREQFWNAEPRFYTAWVQTGKALCEQMFSASPLIVLKKSFLGDEQKFLGPLMCLASGDVRDHIVSHKNDGPS